MNNKIMVYADGPTACFTTPDFGANRMSYLGPTHSAARSMLQNIHWKQRMFLTIDMIEFLSPIEWDSHLQNEIKTFRGHKPFNIEDSSRRTQRVTTVLKDVKYLIHASIHISPRGREEGESLSKHCKMFRTRARRGEQHDQPCFGLREYSASLSLVEDRSDYGPPVNINRNIGTMYFDRLNYMDAWYEGPHVGLFFKAEIRSGILRFPTYDQVVRDGLRIERAA